MRLKDWLRQLYQASDLLCLGYDRFCTQIRSSKDFLALLDFAESAEPLLAQLSASGEHELLAEIDACHRFCLLTPATFRRQTIIHNGQTSGRCDPNIFRRKYFVLECDIAPNVAAWQGIFPNPMYDGFDLQAGVIRHLFDQHYPIVSIVHSGNKSLHIWCSGQGLSEGEIEERVAYTAPLGADAKAGRCRSQFMRCVSPRHPIRPQPLLYFNSDFINHEQ
jgi:hypothetical protein